MGLAVAAAPLGKQGHVEGAVKYGLLEAVAANVAAALMDMAQ
jgi:hypothetical protein